MQIKKHKGVDSLKVQAVFMFFWKAIAEAMGSDSPAIRLTSLHSVPATVRFRWRWLYYYLWLQGAGQLNRQEPHT